MPFVLRRDYEVPLWGKSLKQKTARYIHSEQSHVTGTLRSRFVRDDKNISEVVESLRAHLLASA